MVWAIVLGGSSGLGLASARRLASDGYKLCVIYREPRVNQANVLQVMTQLASLTTVLHFNADALTETGRNHVLDALEKALQAGERVSVLLHSLAKGALKPLNNEVQPPKIWPPLPEASNPSGGELRDTLTAISLQSSAGSQALSSLPELTSVDVKLTVEAMGISLLDWVTELRTRQLFASDTRVLAFTSEGSQRVWAGYGAVSAAKATLEALVRTIAYELGPLGIRANCIQAGITETAALNHIPNNALLKHHAVARNPLGRLTTPDDVAKVVGLLCKPDAAWINGTVVIADGGEHLC
jgi:enoyl-[acyl-carrier protein] reductase III